MRESGYFSSFSYARFKRGMNAICKAQTNPVSASTALMAIAMNHNDDQTVKAFFASPRGYLIDEFWWNEDDKHKLSAWRMEYLAQ